MKPKPPGMRSIEKLIDEAIDNRIKNGGEAWLLDVRADLSTRLRDLPSDERSQALGELLEIAVSHRFDQREEEGDLEQVFDMRRGSGLRPADGEGA